MSRPSGNESTWSTVRLTLVSVEAIGEGTTATTCTVSDTVAGASDAFATATPPRGTSACFDASANPPNVKVIVYAPGGSPVISNASLMPVRDGFCCNFGPATSGWTVFDNDWTGSPIMPSDNPFKWRHFEPGLILLCVRWYLRYAVSYRDLEEMMRERGLCVDHTTIYRWVQRYVPEIDKRCRPFLRRTTDSYRIDETYVRVGGAWHYSLPGR